MLENKFFKNITSKLPPLKIVYKLLHDFLFLMLIFFVLALIADGLLPGIISAHIGFYVPAIIIFATIFVINFLSKKFEIEQKNKSHKKTTTFLIVVILLLFLNSIIKITIVFQIILAVLFFLTYYLTYKVFSEKN